MTVQRRTPWLIRIAVFVPLCLFLAACHIDMYDQPRYTANQPSDFFADGRAMRPPVPNTVAMGRFDPDSALFTGRVNGELAAELPVELNANLLVKGEKLYNAYCQPCHGVLGDGNGIVAYRGDWAVPSLHSDRLRTVQVGYFFDVITNGVGTMYGYGARIPAEDRWAVIAYMRALQLSQNADVNLLTPADVQQVQGGN
jgi:mono/diheme cytochrome c family protein